MIAYKVVSQLRRVYWFVFRPRTFGVKCVVEWSGLWLMIRNTYGTGHWTFPGGGVERGEQAVSAAVREVQEEVGICLAGVQPIGQYFSKKEYKRDTVYCFVAAVETDAFKVDGHEVAEAAWFSPHDLPAFHSPAVDRIIEMLAGRPSGSDSSNLPRRDPPLWEGNG